MSSAHAPDKVIAVHSTLSTPENMDLNRYGMDVVARVVGEFGVAVAFTPRSGYSDSTEQQRLAAAHFTELGPGGVLRLTGLSERLVVGGQLGAVRAYSSVAQPDWLDNAVPVVNGLALRGLGKNKFEQAKLLGADIPRTLFVAAGAKIDGDALQTLDGGKVVVKPNHGASSNNVVEVKKAVKDVSEALSRLNEDSAQQNYRDKGFVVQEYDPAAPLAGAETLFAEANRLIAEAGQNAMPEVRVYNFADVVDGVLTTRPYVMYRLYAGTAQNMLFPMDINAVPGELLTKAISISAEILSLTGRKGGLVVTDFYVSSTTGGLRVREVNMGNPVTGPKIAMSWLPDSLRALVANHASLGQGLLLGEQLATLALGRKVVAK